MPAVTILLSSASPIFEGTHSSSRLAPVAVFLGFAAPFFGAISRIWLGFDGGGKCDCGFGDARVDKEDDVRKWERGMRRHCYKALSPFFVIQGFLGNRSRDLRRSEFSDAVCGPLPRPLRNHSPWCWFYAAVSCYSSNNRRLLYQLLRLSNCYCTTITPFFSQWCDFSGIFA